MVADPETARRPAWLSLDAAERAVWATCADLVSFLPGRWRHRVLPRLKVVLLDVPEDGQAIDVTLPDGRRMNIEAGRDATLLRKAAKRHSVVLRLPDVEILSTVLKLPRRVMSRLDEVVTTNVPVWTPFAADEIYVKARAVEARPTAVADARHPACKVELRCVPKAAVDHRFAMLAELSIDVDELWLGSDGGFSCDLGSKKTRMMRRRSWAVLALVGLAVLQASALSIVYRIHQDETIAVLLGDLDRVRQAVHARAVRSQMEKDSTKMLAAIEARATGEDSMAFALKRLAAVLPAGARYREVDVNASGTGSLTIVSDKRIDPVSLVAATGLLTVTEVNEMNGAQDADHVYAVAFKTVRQASDPN